MRLLTLGEANEKTSVAMLTDGMPNAYKSIIIASRPQTTDDWLSVAQDIEASRVVYNREHTYATTKSATSDNSFVPNSNKSESKPKPRGRKPPPSPCPRCLEQGVPADKANHWMNECSRERTPRPPKNNNSSPAGDLNSPGGSRA